MLTKQHQHRYSITATPEITQALNALKAELGVKRLRLSGPLTIEANEELTQIREERSNPHRSEQSLPNVSKPVSWVTAATQAIR